MHTLLHWLKPKTPSVLTRWVFLRLLGGIYFIAFASASHQVEGLIGSKGILPAADFLRSIDQRYGWHGRWLVPTVLWCDPSDAAIRVLCDSGMVLSVLLLLGILPMLTTLMLWASYLSLASAGQVFFGFQWDALLLEVGLLAVLYSPVEWQLRRNPKYAPSAVITLLLRLLLFRLMFSSGLGKLTSGDPTWLNFSALKFHYFTQPLPPWTAWYFQQMPNWFGIISVVFTYFAEIVAPLMIFGPSWSRRTAGCSIAVLQLLIIATGNFGFFNLLTLTLCFCLVDDSDWPVRWRARFTARFVTRFAAAGTSMRQSWIHWTRITVAALIVLVGAMRLVEGAFRPIGWPVPLSWVNPVIGSLESLNSYGLFRTMTTQRTEIVVEGSNDGATWAPYEFKWKPGDPMRRPAFAWFDMPRLDWQMWFAALGDLRENWWFVNFARCLLNDSHAVESLLGSQPFPLPPRYVRARTFDYRFTTREEHAATGEWWHREENGLYLPAVSIESFR